MADLANIEQWFINPGNRNSAKHRRIGSGAEFAGENSSWTVAWKNYFSNGGTTTLTDRLPNGHPVLLEENAYPTRLVEQRLSSNNQPSTGRWDPTKPTNIRAPYTFPEGYQYDKRTQENVVTIVNRTGVMKQFLKFGVENWNGTSSTSPYRAEKSFGQQITGLLHGSVANQRIGSSASGCADLFSLYRAYDILTAGREIGWATGIIFPRGKSGHKGNLSSRRAQWPAAGGDGHSGNENMGPFPYGGLFALPPGTTFGTNNMTIPGSPARTISLSEMGVRMARAARNYGFYMIDGGPSISTRVDWPLGGARSTVLGDYNKICRELRYVVNSVTNATAILATGGGVASGSIGTPNGGDIVGGGTPIAPNTAVDAGTPPPPPPPETRTSIGWVARRIVAAP